MKTISDILFLFKVWGEQQQQIYEKPSSVSWDNYPN